MNSSNPSIPSYARVRQWVLEYGPPGSEDKRGAIDYLEIEAQEAISALKGELAALAQGNYIEEVMDRLVGPARRQRHGSYEEWARAMLRWMANPKN